jgi:hypothetical protein
LRKDGCRLIFAVFQNVKNCRGSNDRLKFTRMAIVEQILSRYSKVGRKLMEKVRCTRIFRHACHVHETVAEFSRLIGHFFLIDYKMRCAVLKCNVDEQVVLVEVFD